MSIRNELLEQILSAIGSGGGGTSANIEFSAYAPGNIPKGKAVYIASYSEGDSTPWIAEADSDGASSHPVVGVTTSAANASNVNVMVIGELTGVDTSLMSIGDELFLQYFGDLVNVAPSNYSQSLGTVVRANVDGIIRVNVSNANSGTIYNPTKMIKVERLFDGLSTALTQNPTGLGVANSIQVEFGAAFGTVLDPVMLATDGTVTINTAGTYRIKVALQYGRTGSTGVSSVLFRVIDGLGVQLGRSVSVFINDADSAQYFENDTWIDLPAGIELKFEVMRDAAGNNSGGLVATQPTVDGGNEWDIAPSAAIRVERWANRSV